MVAWIGIVKHSDRHALHDFRVGDRGDVGEKLMLDRLQRPFGYLATIPPRIADLIGKIIGGLRNEAGIIRCEGG